MGAQFNYAATEPACASSSDCPKDQDKCPDSSPCYGACSNGRCDGWVTWAMKDEAKNAFPPGWELIKQGEVFSGNKAAGAEDRDNIKLYKFTATNECVFTFEGSNIEKNGGIQYDLGRFTGHGAGNMVTWCGKKNLHRGVGRAVDHHSLRGVRGLQAGVGRVPEGHLRRTLAWRSSVRHVDALGKQRRRRFFRHQLLDQVTVVAVRKRCSLLCRDKK